MTATEVPAPAIHVQGLEKSYKKLKVLRGVDFDVARGSIFALLGSNGAGKTTVVNILSTLLKADAGAASVNGFDVATQAANVRESISLTVRIPRNPPTQSTLKPPRRSAGFRHPSEAAPAADAKRQLIPLILTSFRCVSG